MFTDNYDYTKLDQPEVLRTLFHPRKQSATEAVTDFIDYEIDVDESVTISTRFHLADLNAPNIIFFHGNGEIVYDYDLIAPSYTELGISFLVIEYRGYGSSDGVPTVSTMLKDIHVIFKKTIEWLKSKERTGPVFIMGRSLGSACALELASNYQEEITGLIIESGFSTTIPLLQILGIDTFALGINESDGFHNVQKIEKFRKPTFILHAQNDQLIPPASAEILQAQSGARNKEFQLVPGADHNSIMARAGKLYFESIKRFIDKATGNVPRRRRKRR